MSSVRLLIGITICVCCPLPLLAAPLAEAFSADGQCRAALSVSPDQPSLADSIVLTLDVTCPEGETVIFPPFDNTLGELHIADLKTTDRQLILTTTPQRSGKTPIWSMEIQCGQQRIVIPATEIDIAANIDTEKAMLDDIGLAVDPFPVRPWLIYVFIAIAVVIALLLLWRYVKRHKAGIDSNTPPLSNQELALRRLADLLESGKHESDVKAFFVELSDIVRWYVECLTGIRAPELTTEEFLHSIARPEHRSWGGTSRQPVRFAGSLETLAPFLESADIVKFAKHQPTNDEVMLAFRRAEHFIQHHVELHTDSGYLPDSGTGP